MPKIVKMETLIDPQIEELLNAPYDLKFRRTKDGDVILCSGLYNAVQLLRNHARYKGGAVYDDFAEQIEIRLPNQKEHERLTEYHVELIRFDFQDRYSTNFKKEDLFGAIEIVAKENRINPLVKHIESFRGLYQEGDPSLCEELLTKYLACEDTPLNRAYSLRWILSIVARMRATLRDPVKCDTVLVLYGEQGIGKSTFLETLCFKSKFGRKYFLDNNIVMGTKDAVQAIQGKIIVELQELAKRSKDQETEKAFISLQIDDLRLPYRRTNERFARRCIFAATTNKTNILTDATGSRRFWCVTAGATLAPGERLFPLLAQLEKDLPRIWSEALYRLDKGEQHWLSPEEEILRIESAQDYTAPHPLTEPVLSIVRNKKHVSISEILRALYQDPDPMKNCRKHLDKSTRQNQLIISDILSSNGWRYQRAVINGKRIRSWFPKK